MNIVIKINLASLIAIHLFYNAYFLGIYFQKIRSMIHYPSDATFFCDLGLVGVSDAYTSAGLQSYH